MIGLNHQGLVEVLKQVKHAAEEGMAALLAQARNPSVGSANTAASRPHTQQ